MRVVICLSCRALMEKRTEESRYLYCHKCKAWFPEGLARRKFRDTGNSKAVWVFGEWEHWVRVKAPGLTGQCPMGDNRKAEDKGIQGVPDGPPLLNLGVDRG